MSGRAAITISRAPLGALEVGDQHLDRGFGQAAADLGDAAGERLGAAVGQVVPVHRGDDHVRQAHALHGLGQADRLQRVERLRRAVRHRAVGAVPGADVAQDHEGGGLVLPALADVGAARLFAHGVQPQLAHHALELHVGGAAGRLDLEPPGFADGGRGKGKHPPRRPESAPRGSAGPAVRPRNLPAHARVTLPGKASLGRGPEPRRRAAVSGLAAGVEDRLRGLLDPRGGRLLFLGGAAVGLQHGVGAALHRQRGLPVRTGAALTSIWSLL